MIVDVTNLHEGFHLFKKKPDNKKIVRTIDEDEKKIIEKCIKKTISDANKSAEIKARVIAALEKDYNEDSDYNPKHFYKFKVELIEESDTDITYQILEQSTDYIWAVSGIIEELAKSCEKDINQELQKANINSHIIIDTGDGDEGCFYVRKGN